MDHTFRAIARSRACALAVASIALLTVGGSAAAVAKTTQHAAAGGKAGISSAAWGKVDGHAVRLYTLKSGSGMTVKITNYGGVVQSIVVPSRTGPINVALGFPKLADYVADFTQGATKTPWPLSGGSGDTYFGAVIGRYANRIAGGTFSLNGKTYKLDQNNGTNTLHGGYLGWNTDVWTAAASLGSAGPTLALTGTFPAGEGCLKSLSPGCTGFPAAMKATARTSISAVRRRATCTTSCSRSTARSTSRSTST
jgi:aldose 1-epimerase